VVRYGGETWGFQSGHISFPGLFLGLFSSRSARSGGSFRGILLKSVDAETGIRGSDSGGRSWRGRIAPPLAWPRKMMLFAFRIEGNEEAAEEGHIKKGE